MIIIGLFVIIALCIYLSLQIWDFSWDGRTYHSVAVHAFCEGWNPFFTKDLGQFANYKHALWVESYPKSNWIFIANNLKLFHNIDSAKFINYALLISTAFVLFRFLRLHISNVLLRLLVIIGFVLNPVVLGQINTLYFDGNLYFLIILFSVSLVNYFFDRSNENFIFKAAITIILINIKFTSLIFIIVGFLMFLVPNFWKSKKTSKIIIVKGFLVFILALVKTKLIFLNRK